MQCLYFTFVDYRRNNVAQDFHLAFHRSNPFRSIFRRRGGNDLGYGLAEFRDADRFLCLPNLLQEGKTFGLELRNGYFLHDLLNVP